MKALLVGERLVDVMTKAVTLGVVFSVRISPHFNDTTRMHSSRMRTGRALTVSGGWGGGGWCIPEGIFLGKRN